MNILLVTEAFYPDGIGGAHTYVYNLAKSLINRGHKVHVLTLKMKKDAPDEEKIEGINVSRYSSVVNGPLVFIRRPLLSIINSGRLFNKISRENKFDVINFHLTLPTFGINLLSVNSRNISRIYTFHSSMYLEVIEQSKKKRYAGFLNFLIFFVIKWMEKTNFKNSDKIITLSEFSRQQIFKIYGLHSLKIQIVKGGVDINNFKPAEGKIDSLRRKLSLPQDKTIILTVRRLAARMGLENLIEAMEKVRQENENFLLLIIGEGFLEGELRRMIKERKLEAYVKLLGKKSQEELPYYYQASDFFVLPTEYSEWFGLVTLEALASGLPAAATPIGGTVEILKPLDQSLLFKNTSSQAIAEGIIRLLNSPEKLNALRLRCREYVVKNFSWNKVALEVEQVFKEVS